MKRSTLLAYALPALAVAMPTLPIYIYLPSFYATEVGLGLTAAGTALLVARIFDTVTDPMAGYISDRLKGRWGRRKPLIVIGAFIAALSMLALVHPPTEAGFVYLLVSSLCLYAGWTLVVVPYTAWGAELTSGYDERSKITAAREGAMLIGILIASAIPVIAVSAGWVDGEAEGLRVIAWAAIVIGFPAFLWLAIRVPDAQLPRPKLRKTVIPGWRDAVRTMRTNKPFLRLFLAWFVNGLANGLPAVLFLLYMEHGLNIGENDRPQYILAYFLPGVLCVPLWIWLSGRIDKHRIWCAAMLIASAAFAVVPLLGPDDAFLFLLVCIATGATLGADLALPPSMQADVVDYDRMKSGRDRTGMYFALWSVATKMALALSVGIAFPVLDLAGFDPTAEQPEAIWALVVIYALVPVVLKVIAVAVVLTFPLGRAKHATIRKWLTKRAG